MCLVLITIKNWIFYKKFHFLQMDIWFVWFKRRRSYYQRWDGRYNSFGKYIFIFFRYISIFFFNMTTFLDKSRVLIFFSKSLIWKINSLPWGNLITYIVSCSIFAASLTCKINLSQAEIIKFCFNKRKSWKIWSNINKFFC